MSGTLTGCLPPFLGQKVNTSHWGLISLIACEELSPGEDKTPHPPQGCTPAPPKTHLKKFRLKLRLSGAKRSRCA